MGKEKECFANIERIFLYMAIFHCSAKIVSRSTGRSSVGASAYRAGEKLYNEYDGMTHDYSKKNDVVHSEIMLCENAPKEYQDRQTLWNAVEKIEKRSTAQLAREIQIALPVELNRDEQIKLVQNYVKDNFVSVGMCADFSIHDKKDGNPHAHIMLTMRSIDENGKWENKAKFVYQLDKNGEKIYNPKNKQYKGRKENTTDWNDKGKIEVWREDWANKINHELERKGIDERVDHRSYERKEIEKVPTIHLGKSAHQLEKRGIQTERGNHNKNIQLLNSKIKQIEIQLDSVRVEKTETQKENIKIKFENVQTSEQVADTLYQLENKTIQEYLAYQNVRRDITVYESKKRNISKQINEIKSDWDNLIRFHKIARKTESELKKLQQESKGLTGFVKNQFTNLKTQIKHKEDELRSDKSQFQYYADRFKKEWKIPANTDEVKEQIDKLREELQQLQYEKIPNEYEAKGVWKSAEQEYKTVKVVAEQRSDYEQIESKLQALEEAQQEAGIQPSLNSSTIRYKLRRITDRDRKEIAKKLKQTQPQKAEKIMEKIHTNQIRQEKKNRGFDMER